MDTFLWTKCLCNKHFSAVVFSQSAWPLDTFIYSEKISCAHHTVFTLILLSSQRVTNISNPGTSPFTVILLNIIFDIWLMDIVCMHSFSLLPYSVPFSKIRLSKCFCGCGKVERWKDTVEMVLKPHKSSAGWLTSADGLVKRWINRTD